MSPRRRLITIGSGSGKASLGRGGACHLVEAGDVKALFDCGEGASGRLLALDPNLGLDAVIFTHLHPDHVSGFFTLLQNMLLAGRTSELPIHIPQSGIDGFKAFAGTVYLDDERLPFKTNYHPVTLGSSIQIGKLSVTPWMSDHFAGDALRGIQQRPAFGYTIGDGVGCIVYTGDISSIDVFRDQLRAGSTLLCEAMHVDWQAVIDAAITAKARKVVFTHADPAAEDDLGRFCADLTDVEYGFDGMTTEW